MLTIETIEALDYLADRLARKIMDAKLEPEKWITLEECAAAIDMPMGTIYKYSGRQDFPCMRGRPIRVKRSQVEEYFRIMK